MTDIVERQLARIAAWKPLVEHMADGVERRRLEFSMAEISDSISEIESLRSQLSTLRTETIEMCATIAEMETSMPPSAKGQSDEYRKGWHEAGGYVADHIRSLLAGK